MATALSKILQQNTQNINSDELSEKKMDELSGNLKRNK